MKFDVKFSEIENDMKVGFSEQNSSSFSTDFGDVIKIDIKFSEIENNMKVDFSEQNPSSFSADFGDVITVTKFIGGDPYNGDYAVIPKVASQTMPTKEKVMLDDVTIMAIPYYETSNNSGGNTVYIGSEV